MTYEEYKAIVMAEFPKEMSAAFFAQHRTAQEFVLMCGDPPLEEMLEMNRTVLRRAFKDMLAKADNLAKAVWSPEAAKSLFPERPKEGPPKETTPSPQV